MTQSEVPRRGRPECGDEVGAGALSIGAFERGRWRLRRTRHLWVFNRLCGFWLGGFAGTGVAEMVILRGESLQQQSWKAGWEVFHIEYEAFPPVNTHIECACRSTL